MKRKKEYVKEDRQENETNKGGNVIGKKEKVKKKKGVENGTSNGNE